MQIEWQEWIGLSPAMFLYALVAIGVAAFIRGYSGFGFSALTVTSLSLILPPAEVVPSAFMLEIAASIYMLPLVWRSVNWKVLRWLTFRSITGDSFWNCGSNNYSTETNAAAHFSNSTGGKPTALEKITD